MWASEGGRVRGSGQQRREMGGQSVGKGTHRGSDTQGTNKKKRRGRWTMTRKEGGGGREQRKIATRGEKKSLPKKDIADGSLFQKHRCMFSQAAKICTV